MPPPRSIDDSALVAHLDRVLGASNRPALARHVLPALVRCIDTIAGELRAAGSVGAVGSSNAFGDEQLNVDVLAERAVRAAVRERCAGHVVTASSEEDPVERATTEGTEGTEGTAEATGEGGGDERYAVAFDPLDGSSIIAPNWSVGTIVGVWDGATALGAAPARAQVAAVLGVYGPRTTAVVAVRVPGRDGGEAASSACFEVALVPKKKKKQQQAGSGDGGGGGGGEGEEGHTVCEIVRPQISMAATGPFKMRYFAPANLRAASEDGRYGRLVSHYIGSRYTLRYSGGLVPDVVHGLVKGHGIYVSPVTAGSGAKLRRLYELAPVALVMECAGARAVDPVTGEDVLARPIMDCDERAGLVCGTVEEVETVRKFMELSR